MFLTHWSQFLCNFFYMSQLFRQKDWILKSHLNFFHIISVAYYVPEFKEPECV